MMSFSTMIVLLVASAELSWLRQSSAFQIPYAGHHHPLFVRYRQEQLEKQRQGPHSQTPCASDIVKTQGCVLDVMEEHYGASSLVESRSATQQRIVLPLEDATICTPVSYDEETGMVQTAVRAIVRHPISNIVDNAVVGLSSTLVITTGALHEVVHCLELEWTHHATSSTEGLALLSFGHFLHYGREAIRQLVELHEDESEESKDDK